MFFHKTASVSVEKAAARIGEPNVACVDVRTPEEYASGHAAGARNYPLDTLSDEQAKALRRYDEVYVICRSGGRSAAACSLLVRGGVKAINVEGGTLAWSSRNLPME